MTEPDSADQFVQVLHADTEFEAHARAAVLHDAGIDARVIADGPSWAGMMRLGPAEFGAGVWVRPENLAAARDTLAQNAADSVDLDWDDVDVGSREIDDDVIPRRRAGMPIPARFAWVVALIMMLLSLILAIVLIFH